MVEADAVLQVADGIVDLGVVAMIGLQVQRLNWVRVSKPPG